MRDPERIGYILDQLKAQWERCPDLRLGQLIYNAVSPDDPCPKIFYIEDEVLLNKIVKYMEAHSALQGRSDLHGDTE